jgi:hypothetical protein
VLILIIKQPEIRPAIMMLQLKWRMGPGALLPSMFLKLINNSQYFQAKSSISNIQMLLPASPAIMGIYAKVDNTRGVWKAPANVNITNVIAPEYLITTR